MSRPLGCARRRPCNSGWRRHPCAFLASASTLCDRHQLRGVEAGFVVRRLAAIAAILGAAAGLDRQQPAALHLVRIERGAVHGLGAEQQVLERQIVKSQSLLAGPVMAQRGRRAGRGSCGRIQSGDARGHRGAISARSNAPWSSDDVCTASGRSCNRQNASPAMDRRLHIVNG